MRRFALIESKRLMLTHQPGLAALNAPPRALQAADVRSLQTLGALLDFEFNLLVLSQSAEAAVVADFAVVSEQVLGAVFRRDETKALAVVKPFHGASLRSHDVFLLKLLKKYSTATWLVKTETLKNSQTGS
jgi:hypothetical protein